MPTTSKPQVLHQPGDGTSVHMRNVQPKIEFIRNNTSCWVSVNRAVSLHFATPLDALAFAEAVYAAVKIGQPLTPAFNPRKRDRMLEGRM